MSIDVIAVTVHYANKKIVKNFVDYMANIIKIFLKYF